MRCDVCYDSAKNWVHPAIVVLNFIVMGSCSAPTSVSQTPGFCYSLVCWRLGRMALTAAREHSGEEKQVLKELSVMVRVSVALSLTYLVCILPNMVVAWGLFPRLADPANP